MPFLPLCLANSYLMECRLVVTSSGNPTWTSQAGLASPHHPGPPPQALYASPYLNTIPPLQTTSGHQSCGDWDLPDVKGGGVRLCILAPH